MLTIESERTLRELFFWRKVRHAKAKKFAVPIGVHEFSIKNIIERETKNGKRLVEMRFYVSPSEEIYGEEVAQFLKEDKVSFAPVKSYHVQGSGHIKDFYKRFTAMKPEYLDQLQTLKGKKFKGLVKHVAHDSMQGEFLLRTEDGYRQKYWTQEIIAVSHLDKEIDFDYFDLVEYGIQDVKKKKEIVAPF